MKSPVASLLWRSLKTYQVFGANTEVGKTIFTTLLARTAQARGKDEKVTFLKPVSTGALADADDGCKCRTCLTHRVLTSRCTSD